ncbi:MAG: GntR family transcriptional regulator [Clostridiales Family XIII bacterium]|jgi:DNA-binding transcriptional regulator YhcF (GntR family)|nr:GntR family transcriptional regulator [Clostridiales Family XIII bacterium]
MEWEFDNKSPIYLQIVERMEYLIVAGVYAPGSSLPSVRDLSVEVGVNPNTMQRALATLETLGLAMSNRTSGRVLTDNMETISALRKKLASDNIAVFLSKMHELGLSEQEVRALVQEEVNRQKLEHTGGGIR